MKRMIFIGVLLTSFKMHAQNAGDSMITLGNTFCVSYDAPQPYLAGTLIKIECDTAYVLNKGRFKIFQEAKTSLINSRNSQSYVKLEEKYEEALAQQDKYYKDLLKSYHLSDSLSQNLIRDTRGDLQSVASSLQLARNNIDSVNVKLAEVDKLLRAQKWQSVGQKIMVGLSGIGVGILTGVLISR